MRRMTLSLTVVAMLTGGCLPRAHKIEIPEHFVALDKSKARPYETRAVSADGVVVALSREKNPEGGTLEFWVKAIESRMTVSKGYRLVSSEPIQSVSKTKGVLMTFSIDKQGAEFTYLLAVYVVGDEVLLAEAGGKADAVRPRIEQIGKALASL